MADENSSDSEYDEKVSKKVKKIIERSHKEALDYWILVQKLKITSEQKKCESCDVYFGTSYHFDEHIRKKHSELSEPIETEKKHLQTNHVVLVESIEQNISTNDENHIASIHIQLQTFGCDYCEETFELENDKSDHVNTNHLKDYQTLLALADIFNKENNEKEARKKLFLLGRKMNQSTEEMQKIINM